MSLSSHRLKILASVLTLCAITSGSLCVPMAAEEVNSEVIYNATRYIKSQVERATINGAAEKDKYYDQTNQWIYEEHPVIGNATDGYFLTNDGEWTTPTELKMDGMPTNTSDFNNELGNCMFYHAGSSGKMGQSVGYYNNSAAIMGGYINNLASALTFVAPKDGYVTLTDPANGKIAQLGYSTENNQNIFGTLKDAGDKIGVAIYKNEEKLWPKNAEYSVLTISEKPDFPGLFGISIKKGDKLRIAFIPITERWGFFQLNPQVNYYSALRQPADFVITTASGKLDLYENEDIDSYIRENVKVRLADGTLLEDYSIISSTQFIGENNISLSYTNEVGTLNKIINATVYRTKYGDFNFDGNIDDADMVMLRKYLSGENCDLHTSIADLNNDGEVNSLDLNKLKEYLENPDLVKLGKDYKWIDPPDMNKNRSQIVVTSLVTDSTTGKTYISKEGKPLLKYGVQLRTDRYENMTEAEEEKFFAKAAELNFKTVIEAAYWREIEPTKGVYNLYKIDKMIRFADNNDLNMEMLWYGSDVTGTTKYAPDYILKDTDTYPLHPYTVGGLRMFDFSNRNLLEREKAALRTVMNYIYDHDKNHRITMIQVENEPNYMAILNEQQTAAYSYLSELGDVIHNSPYKILTRINLHSNSTDLEADDGSPMAKQLVATSGIDMVGVGAYGNDVNYNNKYFKKWLAKDKITDNYLHIAESAGSVSNYLRFVTHAFVNGSGFDIYELKSDGDKLSGFGIYRDSKTEWIERDGTKRDILFPWNTVKYKECVTADVRTFNAMINKVREQLATCKDGNIKMFALADDSAVGSSVFEIDGVSMIFKTDYKKENKLENRFAMCFLGTDGYYYFFTPAASGDFIFKSKNINSSVSVGEFKNGKWIEHTAAEAKNDNWNSTVNISAGNVYRVKKSDMVKSLK